MNIVPVKRLLSMGLLYVTAACGGRGEAQSDERVRQLALELAPEIEQLVGLRFLSPPTIAVRSPEQVRAYLAHKLEEEFGAGEFELVAEAYRLFGLIPDTADLRELLLSLYAEQVVGYYDPDSSALYVVAGASPEVLRLTLAHELVHALQGQHVDLDSLLSIEGNNDRRMAAQAVMEGQATLASLQVMLKDQDVSVMPDLWGEYRQLMRRQQEQMPVFANAPLVIREGLIFSYLAGADFVRWFDGRYRDTVPFGPRLPESTEQILHTDRYVERDRPVELEVDPAGGALYDDNLGEFETRILLTELLGSEVTAAAGALGWEGDRYALYKAGSSEYALVWWSAWESERAAARFATLLGRGWAKRERPGRRSSIEQVEIDGLPGVVLVDGPDDWPGWDELPKFNAVAN